MNTQAVVISSETDSSVLVPAYLRNVLVVDPEFRKDAVGRILTPMAHNGINLEDEGRIVIVPNQASISRKLSYGKGKRIDPIETIPQISSGSEHTKKSEFYRVYLKHLIEGIIPEQLKNSPFIAFASPGPDRETGWEEMFTVASERLLPGRYIFAAVEVPYPLKDKKGTILRHFTLMAEHTRERMFAAMNPRI